jgi:hypothetical protein
MSGYFLRVESGLMLMGRSYDMAGDERKLTKIGWLSVLMICEMSDYRLRIETTQCSLLYVVRSPFVAGDEPKWRTGAQRWPATS